MGESGTYQGNRGGGDSEAGAHTDVPRVRTAGGRGRGPLPGLLHPALQADVPAGLLHLQGGGVGLVPAQGL